MKIKKGDEVIITTGKDKGKSGKVLRAFPQTDMVLVEGVNMVTRHQKTRSRRSQGQMIEKSLPVHVSNVALTSSKKKAARVGYSFEDNKKVRILRPSGEKA